jgi:hypothetical protein
MSSYREAFFVQFEDKFILPVKVIDGEHPFIYKIIERAEWNNGATNPEYRYDYVLNFGDKVYDDTLAFTLRDAQWMLMDQTHWEIKNLEARIFAAKVELLEYQRDYGFVYEERPEDNDDE